MAAEPQARRTIFVGLRSAAIELWGQEGLEECAARFSPEARDRCIAPVVIEPEWLPERYVLEWYLAAWEGPCARDRTVYNIWLQRMMDIGFGVVRRTLLSFASAERVIERAAVLWRHDHTHGNLSFELTGKASLIATLRDHPYVDTPHARASVTEILRYAVALSRSAEVTATHSAGPNRTLVLKVTWRPKRPSWRSPFAI